MAKQILHKLGGGLKLADEDVNFFNGKPSEDTQFFKERLDLSVKTLAERNQAVIDRTIVKYKVYHAQLQKEYAEGLRERTDAVASYLKHLTMKDTPVEKYFGKKELAHLQGRKIMSRIFKAANGQKGAQLYEA